MTQPPTKYCSREAHIRNAMGQIRPRLKQEIKIFPGDDGSTGTIPLSVLQTIPDGACDIRNLSKVFLKKLV